MQPAAGVQGEQDGRVDMAAAEVVGHARVVVRLVQEEQDGLGTVECELPADAAQEAVEVGVEEEPVVRLVRDDGDGVRAAGDQLPGGLVGDVAQLGDDLPDLFDDLGAHLGLAVDHPRDRGSRHPRPPCDVLDRGALSVWPSGQHRLRWGELVGRTVISMPLRP